jgi:agmatine deiminase
LTLNPGTNFVHENATPATLGFSMPAEWEKHEATWLGWPHNPTDWPGKIEPIQWVYAEIVRKIAPGEIVRILVNSREHESHVRKILKQVGVSASRVRFFRFPTNRGWTRDFGPIFVWRAKPRREVAIARFRFNAWARYPDWQKDDAVPQQVARRLKYQILAVRYHGREVVLEGGSIDVNGRGTLLTTEECLLDQKRQVRNPGFSRADSEAALRDNLGVKNIVWLGKGIAGDDTHGHVDDLCRFVNRRTVVLVREKNRHDSNYKPLEENWERLRRARLEDGSKMEVVALPMPAPLHFDGVRLPASYANFYISNSAVLVPTFNDPNDHVALGILGELFPDRAVVGIHAVDLVWGFGTLHCLTQQQPAR